MGAEQTGRDRRCRRRRRGVRPDGEDDAGRHPEEQSDEAADGRLAQRRRVGRGGADVHEEDRKSTRLNSSHLVISYAVFCLKKKTIYNALYDCETSKYDYDSLVP